MAQSFVSARTPEKKKLSDLLLLAVTSKNRNYKNDVIRQIYDYLYKYCSDINVPLQVIQQDTGRATYSSMAAERYKNLSPDSNCNSFVISQNCQWVQARSNYLAQPHNKLSTIMHLCVYIYIRPVSSHIIILLMQEHIQLLSSSTRKNKLRISSLLKKIKSYILSPLVSVTLIIRVHNIIGDLSLPNYNHLLWNCYINQEIYNFQKKAAENDVLIFYK